VLLTDLDLERALAVAGLAAPVRSDEVTSSTNDIARSMAEEGTPEWTLVATAHQTAGRGRLDRAWQDAAGRAVLFSFVLRPTWLPPRSAGMISLAAGSAMSSAAGELAHAEVRCKWPNDLLLGDSKVGGILAESKVSDDVVRHVVVGVGVNLDPPQGVPGAGGLGNVDAPALLGAFLRAFRALYAPDPESFTRRVEAAYAPICITIGRVVEVTQLNGRRLRGRAVGVSEDGSLLIETKDGPTAVSFGDVAHLEG